jgi:hypothetical protein
MLNNERCVDGCVVCGIFIEPEHIQRERKMTMLKTSKEPQRRICVYLSLFKDSSTLYQLCPFFFHLVQAQVIL